MTTLLLPLFLAAGPVKPFAITVVDEQTGRGVPLIELRTTNHLRYVTDSNGVVAFDEPSLMDADVFFSVSGHGYEFPKDGFGFRGAKLRTTPGGSATVKVKRLNIAERLYRITGDGVYADSLKVGRDVPFRNPGKNAQVLGCDSVVMTPYRDKLFWIWGDTNRASYPLGNFHTTAATSARPDPERGIEFEYFTDGKGFVKGIAPMPGKGPTWVESLVTLPGKDGRERLWASYIKVEGLKAHGRGLAVFNDEKQVFEKAADLPLDTPTPPKGHTFRHEGYVYFGHPFPLVRVPATEAAFTDLKQYEAFTVQNGWRKGETPESPGPLLDRATGKAVRMHNGSVNWNSYRKKWVMIGNEIGGKPSHLGEVWYAEADAPTGPWRDAVKIVTHDRMDFYNPKHHPAFDRDGGRVIYFEGTYTNTFSGNPNQTPRYEYNQVMYKLDLADERLHGNAKR